MADEEISNRKADHVRLATSDHHRPVVGPGWSDLHLIHDALPSVSAEEIDLSAELLGRRLELPLVIVGMTGGYPEAKRINGILARIADEAGIAMGVGSQRAALRDPSLVETYRVARDVAPNLFLIGNAGIAQLLDQDDDTAFDAGTLHAAIEMIGADAMVVHLNYLEESVQPEGQTRAAGAFDALAAAVRAIDVPLVLKETGSGISRSVALRAREAGVAAVDVGGVGGTSFAAIESQRAEAIGDQVRSRLGRTFGSWGIPTAACVAGCAGVLPVIATGGVRTGLDAAKAIALGATAVGVGRPLLQAALESEAHARHWITAFAHELRTAIFLTGGRSVSDLYRVPRVVRGELAEWLRQLGYPTAPPINGEGGMDA